MILPGMRRRVIVPTAAGGPATKTFRGALPDDSNLDTYSFSGITASATDTFALVGVTNFGRTISSATITGNVSGAHAASVVANASGAGFVIAPLLNDTSFNVSITLSSSTFRCSIHSWSGNGMSLAVHASDTADSSDPFAATIATPSGGAGFAIVSRPAAGFNWTNYVEDGDIDVESGVRSGSASILGPDSTGPSVTAVSGAESGLLAVVTFGPG